MSFCCFCSKRWFHCHQRCSLLSFTIQDSSLGSFTFVGIILIGHVLSSGLWPRSLTVFGTVLCDHLNIILCLLYNIDYLYYDLWADSSRCEWNQRPSRSSLWAVSWRNCVSIELGQTPRSVVEREQVGVGKAQTDKQETQSCSPWAESGADGNWPNIVWIVNNGMYIYINTYIA